MRLQNVASALWPRSLRKARQKAGLTGAAGSRYQGAMSQAAFILCADDYAMTPGVSRGILDLVEQGRLSAAGCMTNRPHWSEWGPRLLAHRGEAGIGVHLNLTLGAPLGAMPRVAPSGTLPALPDVARAALSGAAAFAEIRAEVGRQIDRFAEIAGGPPDFVDGHQHVHVLPGVRRALLGVLSERGLARSGLWLRDPRDTLGAIGARKVAAGKAAAVAALATGFGAAARHAGFLTNRGFAGFSPFDPSRDYAAEFATYLEKPGPAHLVMCHPGEIDDELPELDPVVGTRPQELAFLKSDAFPALLAARGLQLVTGPARDT